MALIDTHCHYNMEPLWADWQNHWIKAQENGLVASVLAGADQLSCERGLIISQTEPKLFAAIGFHPEVYDSRTATAYAKNLTSTEVQAELNQLLEADIAWLTKQAQTHKIVAIGETGLDYYYFDSSQSELNQLKKTAQAAAFSAQINLANQLKLPLIVHTRDKTEAAYRDALNLIKQLYQFNRPFILHCVSGPLDYIDEAVKLGGYVGFDGNITYKKNDNLVEIFHHVPKDRILLETDAPFLPPVPYRGQTCEPWMVSLTADYLQAHLDINHQQLTANALKCFDLDLRIMG
jgi:TatD DNase family protein